MLKVRMSSSLLATIICHSNINITSLLSMETGAWKRSPVKTEVPTHLIRDPQAVNDLTWQTCLDKLVNAEVEPGDFDKVLTFISQSFIPENLPEQALTKLLTLFNDPTNDHRLFYGHVIRTMMLSPEICQQLLNLGFFEQIWNDSLSPDEVKLRLQMLIHSHKLLFERNDSPSKFIEDIHRLSQVVITDPELIPLFLKYIFCFVDFLPSAFEHLSTVLFELLKRGLLNDKAKYFLYWICWKAARNESQFPKVAEFATPEYFGSKEECLNLNTNEETLCAFMGLIGFLAEHGVNSFGVSYKDITGILSVQNLPIEVQSSCLWLLQRILTDDDVYEFPIEDLIQCGRYESYHVKSEAGELLLFILDKLDDATALNVLLEYVDDIVGFVEADLANEGQVSAFLGLIWNACCTACEMGPEKKDEFVTALQKSSFESVVAALEENPTEVTTAILTPLTKLMSGEIDSVCEK